MSRVNVEPERRRPFFLRLDEAHALATLTMADILQEARKYGLGLVMAHQYLDQMELEVQKAILAHVGTLIAFKVGPYDAEVLAKYFAPEFNEAGLMHLGRGEVYLRLMMGGVQSEAFSARTLLPDLLQLPS